jgi:hypothetical protein
MVISEQFKLLHLKKKKNEVRKVKMKKNEKKVCFAI